MYCTQIIQFDAAHRIIGHQGKCRKLHGHRYVLEATFTADTLNDLNMIIDFATIKAKLKSWIDECWDHNTVLSKADKNLSKNRPKGTSFRKSSGGRGFTGGFNKGGLMEKDK